MKKPKKQFCVHGHDTFVTGRNKQNACMECLRIRDREEYVAHPRPKTQFCPKGHDTFVVGRDESGYCVTCKIIRRRIDETKDSRIKNICPQGHDKNVVGRGKKGVCKECRRINSLKWAREHPEQVSQRKQKYYQENKEKSKNNNLIWNYNITLEDYNKMLEKQGGGCAICGSKEIGVARAIYFYVDHNHTTDEVRGLLCNPCNCLVGFSREDIKILLKTVAYIKKHNKQTNKIRRHN